MRRRAAASAGAVALVAAAALLLSGCTGSGTSEPGATPSATPTPTVSAAPADSPLRSVYPDEFTEATSKKESVRLADAVQGLLDASTILYVDDHSQLVDATDDEAEYFGVLRTITLDPTVDPVLLAQYMDLQLRAAGWNEIQVSNEDGTYYAYLASSENDDQAWYLLLGGDSSVEGQSVVTLQFVSPYVQAE
jgi:hypothetical protein